MPNPAFIVEGQMEQRIIAQICPGQPVRRINCNGDNVSPSRLCDFIETHVRLLGNRHYPIIVIFDREGREQTVDILEGEILGEFERRGLKDQDIRLFIADRETEDWYLLDAASICAHYGLPKLTGSYRGKGGLSRMIRPAVDYHETTIGVELFSIVSKRRIAEKCSVFRRLVETATEIRCHALTDDLLI